MTVTPPTPAPPVLNANTTHVSRTVRRLAIAGNPNCGKTTIFNALTGLRQKVANYPGVTVEKREGAIRGVACDASLIDLPGAYSLSARSPDEQIPRDVLLGRLADTPRPEGVLLVVDSANLERNLYFATQVLDLGMPAVLVCNMMDRAAAAGTPVDDAALSRELGVAVVATVGRTGAGLDHVRSLICAPLATPPARRWRLPQALERTVAEVAAYLKSEMLVPPECADGTALLLLTDAASDGAPPTNEHDASAARTPPHEAHIPRPERAAPDQPGSWPPEVERRLSRALRQAAADGFDDVAGSIVEARYTWITEVAQRVIRRLPDAGRRVALSDRIDRVLTHRVAGLLILAGILQLVFLSIFLWAEPFMGLIESGQGWLQDAVRQLMTDGPLRDLIINGLIGGVGSVVVFFPQICILFLWIALLEDSGYMARAAFLMDKLMSKVGLHGKSFIPLLSSFACAIPGIMATRTIENRRDRFTTILVAPLMSCSARLPVYLTLIAVILPGSAWIKAAVILCMYALGTVAALLMALLLKRTLLRGPRPTFIMELPPYHLPSPWSALRAMWDRGKLFLTRAGTQIVAICIVLWALGYFPRMTPAQMQAAGIDNRESDEAAALQLRQSYLGRLGTAIEPLIRPMGFDWKIGIGILSSFAAREVFVGTMGTIYGLGEVDESSEPLRDAMRAERWPAGSRAGQPVYSVPAGLALMVFYVLCCQCASTLAVARRETNSWRWPAFMFVYMTLLAYGAALVVFQAATIFA